MTPIINLICKLRTVGRPGTQYTARLASASTVLGLSVCTTSGSQCTTSINDHQSQQKLCRACLDMGKILQTGLSAKDEVGRTKQNSSSRGNSQSKITEAWKNKIYFDKTKQVRMASKDGVWKSQNWNSSTLEQKPSTRQVCLHGLWSEKVGHHKVWC